MCLLLLYKRFLFYSSIFFPILLDTFSTISQLLYLVLNSVRALLCLPDLFLCLLLCLGASASRGQKYYAFGSSVHLYIRTHFPFLWTGPPGGNFLKCCTNIHLNSQMKWWDFGGQGFNVKVTVSPCLSIRFLWMRYLWTPRGNHFKYGIHNHLESRMN